MRTVRRLTLAVMFHCTAAHCEPTTWKPQFIFSAMHDFLGHCKSIADRSDRARTALEPVADNDNKPKPSFRCLRFLCRRGFDFVIFLATAKHFQMAGLVSQRLLSHCCEARRMFLIIISDDTRKCCRCTHFLHLLLLNQAGLLRFDDSGSGLLSLSAGQMSVTRSRG